MMALSSHVSSEGLWVVICGRQEGGPVQYDSTADAGSNFQSLLYRDLCIAQFGENFPGDK